MDGVSALPPGLPSGETMLKTLIPLLLVFAIASSGCIGLLEDDGETDKNDDVDPKDDHDGTRSDDDVDPTDDDGDKDDDSAANQAPDASLAANVTRGEAPLMVRFSVSASDPDGDEISWTLDLGDGMDPVTGDDSEKTVDVTFEQVGNITARLNVSDGEDDTADELVVRVFEVEGPVQTFEGGWMVSLPATCVLSGPGLGELMGVFTNGTLVDEASVGSGFTANFTTETSETILMFIVNFVNTENDHEIVESFSAEPGEEATGTVPDGADTVYFRGCGVSGPVDVFYTAG